MRRNLLLFILLVSTLSPLFSQGFNAIRVNYHESSARYPLFLNSAGTQIEICGLSPNESYNISFSGAQEVLFRNAKDQKFLNQMTIQAGNDCFSLEIQPQGNQEHFRSTSLHISKVVSPKNNLNKSLLGLQTNTNSDADFLIKEVFIGGDCFDISGVTRTGASSQTGTFSSGSSSIGIEDGVIISTGNISTALGPNLSPSAGTAVGAIGSDPDLDAISSGGSLFDIASIEFFFQPTLPQVTFEYAFASDEYCEFANTQYNDVFGFFISGPGISGPYSNNAINIATLPSGANVAINSVNHTMNTGYYVDNSITESCASGSPFNPDDIEFDGFTTVLLATANVIPCEIYRIKLIIADRGDGIYDSAVFLKSNSFLAGATASAGSSASGFTLGEAGAYEGCSDGVFYFERIGDDLSEDVFINFVISPSSTATPGDDYIPFETSVIIPAGESTVEIPVTVLADDIAEGTEIIMIEFEDACSCSSQSIEIQIIDPPPLQIIQEDIYVCTGETIEITPTLSGGLGNYSYQWGNNSSDPSISFEANQTQSFSLQVSDECGGTASTSFSVIPSSPTADLAGQGFICEDNINGDLLVNLSGNGPFEITYAVNGSAVETISDIASGPISLPISEAGTYELLSVTGLDGCPGEVSGFAEIDYLEISATMFGEGLICNNFTTGEILVSLSGLGPFDLTYSINGTNYQTLSNIPTNLISIPANQQGIYELVSVSGFGACPGEVYGYGEVQILEISVQPEVQPVSCADSFDASINLHVQGGAAPYNYTWVGGIPGGSSLQNLGPGYYPVTVTDQNGCQGVSAVVIDAPAPLEVLIQDVQHIDCNNPGEGGISAFAYGGGGLYYYEWSEGSYGDQVTGLEAGTYFVTATDQNNCTAETTATIENSIEYPQAIALPQDTLSCINDQIAIHSDGSSSGPAFEYEWFDSDSVVIATGVSEINVSTPGSYSLSVLNTENGCSQLATIEVAADWEAPLVQVSNPDTLDCINNAVEINSQGSSAGNNFSYLWTTTDGNILSDSDGLLTSVNAAGIYALQVTNTQNGCSSHQQVEVFENVAAPTIEFLTPEIITCLNDTVQLSVVLGPNQAYSYEWSEIDGNLSGPSNQPFALATTSGDFQLLVSDIQNGCTTTDTLSVNDNLVYPEAEAGLPVELDCQTSIASLSGIYNGSLPVSFEWTSEDGNLVSGINTLSPEVNAPGIYTLSVTNTDNGCASSDIVDVQENSNAPLINAQVNGILNCNESIIEIDASGSSEGSNYVLDWSSEDNNPIENSGSIQPSVSAPGVYTLTITDLENSCVSTLSVTVEQDIVHPVVEAGPDTILNCYTPNLTLDIGNSDQGDQFQLAWSASEDGLIQNPDQASQEITNPGTYYLTLSNTENGCISIDSVEIRQDFHIPEVNAGPDFVLNCAVQTVNLQGFAAANGDPFYFNWNILEGTAPVQTDIFSPTINEGGVFELFAFNDLNGCFNRDTAMVVLDIAPPIANAGPSTTLNCDLQEVNLNGNGSSQGSGFSYLWNSEDGQFLSSSTQLNPLINAPGLYQLIVTNDANHCKDTATVVIDQDIVSPIISIVDPAIITCAEPVITVDASSSDSGAPFLFEWTDVTGNSLGSNSNILAVEVPGEYFLLLTNTENGCFSQASVMVEKDPNIPLAEAGNPLTLNCNIPSVQLDGSGSTSGPNIHYSWEYNGLPIANSEIVNPTVGNAGTYVLHVENMDNNCIERDSVLVSLDTIAPQAVANVNGVLTCTQNSLTLNGSGSSIGNNFTYNWQSEAGAYIQNAQGLNPTVFNNGIFQLTVENESNGCKAQTNVLVEIDTLSPTISIAEPGILTCAVTEIPIQASASGNHPLSYQWSTNDGQIISGSNSLDPMVIAAGDYLLSVQNEGNGCENHALTQVFIDTIVPQANAGQDALLTCEINSLELDGSLSSQGQFTYNWQTNDGHILYGTNNLFPMINGAGVYTLSVTNQGNACVNSDQVMVEIDTISPPAFIPEPDILSCAITSVQLVASSSYPGNFNYTWRDQNNNIIYNPQANQVNVSNPGLYFVEVIDPQNGCQNQTQVNVLQDIVPPVAEAGSPITLNCNLLQTELDGTFSSNGAIYSYQWASEEGNIISGQNTKTPLINQVGYYTLLVTNTQNGCSAMDDVFVDSNSPEAEVLSSSPACPGDFGFIQVIPSPNSIAPFVYSINNGNSFGQETDFLVQEPGTYVVIMQDVNGCEYRETAIIDPPQDLQVFVNPQVTINLGESYTLQTQITVSASDIQSVVWTPAEGLSCTDCLEPVVSPLFTTSYQVQVLSEQGCEAEANINFIVDRRPKIYIPNAFSPYDNDGINDFFFPFAKENSVTKFNSLQIYSRWGELVYEVYDFPPNDPDFGWDGLHNGQKMNTAVFAYWTEAELIDGSTVILEGDVTLMR